MDLSFKHRVILISLYKLDLTVGGDAILFFYAHKGEGLCSCLHSQTAARSLNSPVLYLGIDSSGREESAGGKEGLE